MSTYFYLLVLANIPAAILFNWSLKRAKLSLGSKWFLAVLIFVASFGAAIYSLIFVPPWHAGVQGILGLIFLLFFVPFVTLPIILLIASGTLIVIKMTKSNG